MENLTLPEPAAGLWAAKRSIVHAIPPEMFGRSIPPHLGDGTILAARWKHCISTDIDVLLPGRNTLIDLLQDNDRNIINQLGGTPEAVAGGRVKIAFENGFLDISTFRPAPLRPRHRHRRRPAREGSLQPPDPVRQAQTRRPAARPRRLRRPDRRRRGTRRSRSRRRHGLPNNGPRPSRVPGATPPACSPTTSTTRSTVPVATPARVSGPRPLPHSRPTATPASRSTSTATRSPSARPSVRAPSNPRRTPRATPAELSSSPAWPRTLTTTARHRPPGPRRHPDRRQRRQRTHDPRLREPLEHRHGSTGSTRSVPDGHRPTVPGQAQARTDDNDHGYDR